MAKINLKRGLADIVLYLIIFIVVQIIVMYAGAGIWAGIKGEGYQATLLAISSGSNPILMALSKPWVTLLWVALFSLGTIIPLELIYEQIGIEMDENAEQILASLMKEPWGYVAIGILAPFAEEVVFRGAILRTLLGLMSKKNHWVAIMISAAIFGLAHANVAQFINALLLGLLLGWMYYRTKSLVPGILLHWVNNTMAYVLSNIIPQSDGKLIDLFHGDEKTMYYAVGFSLCIMIPSFIQLVIRLKKVKA